MITGRNTARRALTSAQRTAIRSRRSQFLEQPAPAQARKRQYSTAKDSAKETSSSHLPWIIGATLLTAGGIYLSLPTPKSSHQNHPHPSSPSPSPASNSKTDKPLTPEDEKKAHARADFLASMKADAPKAEHGGDSVLNHGKAAEANEKRVRRGKFSGREFDNTDMKHSGDPGRDFEFIEKEEGEGEGKGKKEK